MGERCSTSFGKEPALIVLTRSVSHWRPDIDSSSSGEAGRKMSLERYRTLFKDIEYTASVSRSSFQKTL